MYFSTKDVERVDTERGRTYLVDGKRLPSVTTILGATSTDQEWLEEWRNRVGIAEADRIRDESADIGTKMHARIEDFFRDKEPKPIEDENDKVAEKLATESIRFNLKRVKKALGIECVLWSHVHGYAGTCDLVCEWSDRRSLSVLDHKSSRSTKKEPGDYSLQIAAYAIAHDEMYDSKIETAIVSVASRYGKGKLFVLEGSELAEAKEAWLRRVSLFKAI